ncbi:MAG: DNA-binding protein [Eubacteriales bacterium]|nr:DNA-binding protein [Eubacteriales bacterium]
MQNLDSLEKHIELGQLFTYYGKLLPAKTRLTLEHYLADDLTLSEIAENEGRSRQAVHAQVKNACNQLYTYDLQLGLLQKAELYLDLESELINRIENGNKKEALALLQAVRALFSLEGQTDVSKPE